MYRTRARTQACEPTFTLVVPCRDRAESLRRAVDAALAVPAPELRVVVVDDASEDATGVLRRRYQAENRVGWIRLHERQGTARARNIGLTYCSTDGVGFLDLDAFLCSRNLGSQLEAFGSWWRSTARTPTCVPPGGWFPTRLFERLGGFCEAEGFERDLRERARMATDAEVVPVQTCSHTVWGPLWMQPNRRIPQAASRPLALAAG